MLGHLRKRPGSWPRSRSQSWSLFVDWRPRGARAKSDSASPAESQSPDSQESQLLDLESLVRARAQDGTFFLVAGVNVLEEDERVALQVAREVRRVSEALGLPAVFKASFDKANRTSASGYRGVGVERGLARLAAIRHETGLPVVCDVHEPWQVGPACAAGVDMLQVPSFLCRQTDLIRAAAETGKPLLLKRGQFASPAVMANACDKARAAGNPNVLVCERGVTFGFNDLVFDPRQLVLLAQACQAPVVMDVTHACQTPPSLGAGQSGGDAAMVPVVARAAVAAGVDGVFIECHPDPANAPVDGALQLPLDDLEPLLATLIRISTAARPL